MPLESGPPLEALLARRTAKVSAGAVVDLLMVAQDAGETEGLPAREAHVFLLLRVDARVVAQRHGVGEGLGAEGAGEVARLVRVLVVEEAAGVAIAALANVAREHPLLFGAGGAARGAGAGVGRQLLAGRKRLFTPFAL